MLQISLLLMKSLNKTETPIFSSIVCSVFPNAIFLMVVIPIDLKLQALFVWSVDVHVVLILSI